MTTTTSRKNHDATAKRAGPAPTPPDSVDELTALDDDVDPDAAPESSHAIDPLAAEPLTADEIAIVQRRDPDLPEEEERALQAMQQGTEAQMPLDADSEDPLEPSADQSLEVRRRPRAKDDTARPPRERART